MWMIMRDSIKSTVQAVVHRLLIMRGNQNGGRNGSWESSFPLWEVDKSEWLALFFEQPTKLDFIINSER
jgi:hypothetical protein